MRVQLRGWGTGKRGTNPRFVSDSIIGRRLVSALTLTFQKLNVRLISALLLISLILTPVWGATPQVDLPTVEVIVQGYDVATVKALVHAVGGVITHELGLINAVGAQLSTAQQNALQGKAGITKIYASRRLEVAGPVGPDTIYPTIVGADQLHLQGVTGAGVTVAVLDTGYWGQAALNKNTANAWRVLAQYDAVVNQVVASGTTSVSNDGSGHGTHVTSIILSANPTSRSGAYQGIAPDANLVSVKAFDANGAGSYPDVIRGIDWVVANKIKYNIRVLNLSFSAPPHSYYWDDPLNQAVMRAWQAGIVVVAAAGNTGPNVMTIGVPGNVPYVITAGAFSDNYTPTNLTDDRLASFSAAGPTVEGFVKPEVVAPGGPMLGMMSFNTQIAVAHPEFHDSQKYFTMSGTSQATAVASGIAALMLQKNPLLTPDQVKYRILLE